MTVRYAGLALAILTASAVFASGGDVTLRWNFEKNKLYHYVIVQRLDTSIELSNVNMRVHIYQRCEMTWTVKSVMPDGSAEISEVFDRIQTTIDGSTGEEVDVDSRRKAGADAAGGPTQAIIERMSKGIVGTPIDIIMSARGEMISVKVPAKIMNALTTAGPKGQAFGGAFTEKGMKQLIVRPPMLLPERAVSAGSSWAQKRSIETATFGNAEINTTCTDKGDVPGQPKKLRQIDATIVMQFRQQERRSPSYRIASQANSARFFFDAGLGHLTRSEVKHKMQIELDAGHSLTENLTQTVTMTLMGEPAAN